MRRMAVRITVVLLVGLFAAGMALPETVDSTSRSPAAVDHLAGSWQGSGMLFGVPATFSMTWQWVLDGKFLHLTFENRIPREGAEDRVMAAQAFYRPTGDDGFEGTWFDSRGRVGPRVVIGKDFTLVTHWGSPDTERGKTEYRVVSKDSIEVVDFVFKNADWSQFGSAGYWRVSDP